MIPNIHTAKRFPQRLHFPTNHTLITFHIGIRIIYIEEYFLALCIDNFSDLPMVDKYDFTSFKKAFAQDASSNIGGRGGSYTMRTNLSKFEHVHVWILAQRVIAQAMGNKDDRLHFAGADWNGIYCFLEFNLLEFKIIDFILKLNFVFPDKFKR